MFNSVSLSVNYDQVNTVFADRAFRDVAQSVWNSLSQFASPCPAAQQLFFEFWFGGMSNNGFISNLLASLVSERIVKIGEYLAKLRVKVCVLFFTHSVVVGGRFG